MPFVAPQAPKCPKCGGSVYAAEERVAGGLKWHATCFKCGFCGKALDSTNCAEHQGELYCRGCHGRKFGIKGYGFGAGAGCLSTDAGEHIGHVPGSAPLEPKAIARAPDGEGCPRCGGFVYAAEQMLALGKMYHRSCYNCVICHKTLDSIIHCDGPDKEVYCRGSKGIKFCPTHERTGWHKKCFKCADCAKRLDSVNCCEGPDKDIYCKVCYAKVFGPKGYGYGLGGGALQSDPALTMNGNAAHSHVTEIDTAKIKAKPGQGCPRCGGAVFAAELVLAKGREWHKKCFRCKDCNKNLDSIIACDGPDKDVYCKTCYGKKWGPHGYGFACGSGFLQTDGLTEEEMSKGRPFYNSDTTSIKAKSGEGCPRCGGKVFAAEQQLAKGSTWHKICFNCATCHKPLDSMIACDGPDKEIYCKSCYGRHYGPKGFGYGHSPTLVSTGESTALFPEARPVKGIKGRNGNGCPRCGFAVYAAEQMISKNRIWHRRCFTCGDCSRSLDSTNLNDGPDGDIYCRGCYGKRFGPKGVGFGLGAGALTMA